MRVMVILKADNDSEAGITPDEKLLSEMLDFNEELVKAGMMLAGEGLHPSSKGVRVRFSGGKAMVINGPFNETRELIAGWWMWKVKSMDEAIDWVKRIPNPGGVDYEVEIRQVVETDDFGPELSVDLREKEERLRAEAAKNA